MTCKVCGKPINTIDNIYGRNYCSEECYDESKSDE